MGQFALAEQENPPTTADGGHGFTLPLELITTRDSILSPGTATNRSVDSNASAFIEAERDIGAFLDRNDKIYDPSDIDNAEGKSQGQSDEQGKGCLPLERNSSAVHLEINPICDDITLHSPGTETDAQPAASDPTEKSMIHVTKTTRRAARDYW